MSKKVAISFDDGLDQNTTSQLLDILDRYQAKAKFSVVGERAERYRYLIKEIVRRGHGIGIQGGHTGVFMPWRL